MPRPWAENRNLRRWLPTPDAKVQEEAERSKPLCRICWGEAEAVAGSALVSPCNCKGSVKYIHLRCLQQWQQTLRAQRQHSRAHICELCHRRYKWPVRAELARHPQPSKSWQEVLLLAWEQLTTAAEGSCWLRALEVWKKLVLTVSVASAVKGGLTGMAYGGTAGTVSAGKSLHGLVSWSPELAVVAAFFPALQVPLFLAACAVGVGVTVEVALTTVFHAYVGSLTGFTSGMVMAVRMSAAVPICAAAVGAKALGFAAGNTAKLAGKLSAVLLSNLLK